MDADGETEITVPEVDNMVREDNKKEQSEHHIDIPTSLRGTDSEDVTAPEHEEIIDTVTVPKHEEAIDTVEHTEANHTIVEETEQPQIKPSPELGSGIPIVFPDSDKVKTTPEEVSGMVTLPTDADVTTSTIMPSVKDDSEDSYKIVDEHETTTAITSTTSKSTYTKTEIDEASVATTMEPSLLPSDNVTRTTMPEHEDVIDTVEHSEVNHTVLYDTESPKTKPSPEKGSGIAIVFPDSDKIKPLPEEGSGATIMSPDSDINATTIVTSPKDDIVDAETETLIQSTTLKSIESVTEVDVISEAVTIEPGVPSLEKVVDETDKPSDTHSTTKLVKHSVETTTIYTDSDEVIIGTTPIYTVREIDEETATSEAPSEIEEETEKTELPGSVTPKPSDVEEKHSNLTHLAPFTSTTVTPDKYDLEESDKIVDEPKTETMTTSTISKIAKPEKEYGVSGVTTMVPSLGLFDEVTRSVPAETEETLDVTDRMNEHAEDFVTTTPTYAFSDEDLSVTPPGYTLKDTDEKISTSEAPSVIKDEIEPTVIPVLVEHDLEDTHKIINESETAVMTETTSIKPTEPEPEADEMMCSEIMT